MTKEDREFLQGVIDDIYSQFVADVAEGRGMDIEEVKRLADGRIFTGRQAKENKLIDKLGNLEDAINIAARMAGIDDDPSVVEDKREEKFIEWLLGDEFNSMLPSHMKISTGPYFLWPAW